MPIVKRPIVRFARFKNWVFPLTRADFDILRENNVTTFRMDKAVLETVAKTLLKSHLPKIIPFGTEVFPKILETTLGALSKDKVRLMRDQNQLRIKYYDDYAEEFNAALIKFTQILGRFCFTLRKDISARTDDVHRVQYTVVFDPTISPSHFYGVPRDDGVEGSTTLRLSNYARLTLRKAQSTLNVNRQALQIIFEDLQCGKWVEVFTRSFETHSLDQDELLETAKFFIGMTSLLKHDE